MKKNFLLTGLIMMAMSISAQQVISNGEDTGINWWQAGSTAVEYVSWHPKEGNPSEKSMTIWISTNSDVWSGGGISNLNIDVSTNNKISVLVFKNVAGTVRLELQDGTANYFVSANYSTPGAWQKLVFAIPSGMGNIRTLLIAPFIDYNLSTIVGEQSRCFWDDVIVYNDTTTGISNPSELSNADIIKTEIFNMNGSLIETNNIINPFNNLKNGLYMIRYTLSNGQISNRKVSVVR